MCKSRHDQLTSYFADPDWIINQKTGFMVDSILTHINKKTGQPETNRFILNSVKGAERKLRKRGIGITSGRIISHLAFGQTYMKITITKY